MSHEAVTLVHRWFDEVWNQGREATIDELFGPDCVAYGLGEGEVEARGPAEFKTFWRGVRDAFPDVKITIQDTITQGDKVVVRVILRGTHKGKGGFGIDPTNRPVSVSGTIIVRVANGQVHEGWNYWDQLGLLQQIGALPAPPDRFIPGKS